MTQLDHLTATELASWLARITQSIDRSLRNPVRGEIVAALLPDSSTRVGLGMLAPVALLADCLRVAHIAIEADGRVETVELTRIADLVSVAAPKYFQVLPEYEAFEDGAVTAADVARFMRVHRADRGIFGYANPVAWRGLELVRAVETHSRNGGPLREHETILSRVMENVFAGRATDVERSSRRKLRALFEPVVGATGLDPRAVAFCRADGPEVFSGIAYAAQIHERDQFDVEVIHAEARDVFHREVERATTPAQHANHGRTLLILGDSGAGKTHLIRALRTQLHSQRMGYAGYLQMTSEVTDYARYVLRNLIDSLERPYDAPAASESGLTYLSNGIAEGRAGIPAAELETLRSAELSASELDKVLGAMVDRIVRTEGLERLEVDLLHALLLLQRRDVAIQRRVVKYLRCEHLGSHDRELLGGLATREHAEDPMRTIRQLGTVMYELQLASLVLFIDQIEDTFPDGQTATRMQQAFDSLRAIADCVPSAVVVIACLADVYEAVRPMLSRPVLDRLESSTPPVRLATQRELPEIEEMLGRRLEHLYSVFDVPWHEDEPLYPFTAAQVESVSRFRARDCLVKFREFHAACIAAKRIVAPGIGAEPGAAGVPPIAKVAPPEVPRASADLERHWNDALAVEVALPEDDDAVLALVADGLRIAAAERGVAVTVAVDKGHIRVTGGAGPRRVLEVCNRVTQGGHLTKQLDGLRSRVKDGAIPIALRNSDWIFPPKSATNKQVAAFVGAGGRTIVLGERDLRAVLATQKLAAAAPPGWTEWRRATQPLALIPFVREVLELDRVVPAQPSAPTIPPMPPLPPPAPRAAPQPIAAAADPTKIRLGTTATMRAEPILLGLEDVKTHVAFLGTTGSGKTTAALAVVEQLLERGISVLLVDRKGDLALYARDAWWTDPTREHLERRRALRARIEVDLFTPGNPAGRPLRLPLVPPLGESAPQDRDQLAKFAAAGLAAMMGYGKSSAHGHKLSILQCAIGLHVGDREITLAALHDTISQPDPELLQRVNALHKHFASLSEDLQSLAIQKGSLLAGDGDALDVAAMLPPASPTTRARLTIINTAAIAEIPVLEFWISRLLVELGRLARKRPSKTLQGAAFFDEADAYIPAVGSPPTKEPMFDLLRRARSAGLAMLVATQNPGDLDYKARELVGTWLVGKVNQDRAIEKMRNLLGDYPNVAGRLANQSTGQFFMLRAGGAVELRCDRSMMLTEQLSETEVAALAKRVA